MFKKKKKAEAAAVEAEAAPAAEAGQEGAEGEAPAEAGGKKKLPMKLIIIAAAALLVLGGGGGGAYYFLVMKKAPEAGEHGGKKEKPKKKADKGGHGGASGGEGGEGAILVREGPDGVTFGTMPDIVVNMQTTTGRPANLKLKLTFETQHHEAIEAMDLNLPRLNDTLLTFLRELRPEDLAGSQGTYALTMEIQRRVNLVIAPQKIDAVRIEEYIIS